MALKVCMFVYNNCSNDARVLKEAATLVKGGYKVKIIAVKDDKTKYYELRDGIEIFRVDKNPVHYRLIKGELSGNILKKKQEKSFEDIKEYDSATILKSADKNNKRTFFNKIIIKKLTFKRFAKSFANDLKNHTLKLFLYRWFVYIISAIYNIFLSITIYQILKRITMIFHRQLCFYDFYRRSLALNKKEPSDVYHAHDLNTLYPAYKCAKMTKAKLIYDSHELYVERNKPKRPTKFYKYIISRFEKRLIRKADYVITVGESIANYLSNKYKVPVPVVIMNAPSGTKTNINGKSIRKELNISGKYKIILYCGGITFNRGLEKLIESFTLLPDMYLVFMGYGKPDYLNKLRQIAVKNKIANRFAFYGPVPTTEVTAYTASADLGVAPIENVCLSYYYCAPNKIFEYLIGGIPVVASNFPELEKIIIENKIGYTFDPQDINSIAESIKKVFSDDRKYLEMKNNTIFAAQKYNWENESKKLLEIYKNLE